MNQNHTESFLKRFVNRHPNVRPYISPFKKVARSAYEPARGYLDSLRVPRNIPVFRNLEAHYSRVPPQLQDAYRRYVTEVSNPIMAISYELSIFLYALCLATRPTKVVDLGSGFSSVILRKYAEQSREDIEVWSVDDSEKWLHKTKEFLESMDISSDAMLTWHSFRDKGLRDFDLVLHDLGQVGDVRRTAFRAALALPGKDGMLILDDMNFVGYKRYVRKTTKDMKVELYSLKKYTKDSTGRYSYLLVRAGQH